MSRRPTEYLRKRRIVMPSPLIGGGIKRWCCLTSVSDVCLSVAYIGPKSRTERPRKTKIDTGSPRHTWLGHHFQGQKSRSPGHFGWLFKSLHNLYGWLPPRANCCLSIMNIHGARRAGRRRRKACMGCSVQRTGAGAYRGGRPPLACWCKNLEAMLTVALVMWLWDFPLRAPEL